MGALVLLVIAIAVLFILRTRRSEQNAVVYRRGLGNAYGSREVPGSGSTEGRDGKEFEVPGRTNARVLLKAVKDGQFGGCFRPN